MNLQHWREQLDEKQRKEVAWAETYQTQFQHGTTGHNQLMLIARLVHMLDVAAGLAEEPAEPEPKGLVLTFGKYNGRTLGEVLELDPDYAEWLSREARDGAIRTAARRLIVPTEPAAFDLSSEPGRPAVDRVLGIGPGPGTEDTESAGDIAF